MRLPVLVLVAVVMALSLPFIAACSDSPDAPAVTTPGPRTLPRIRLGYPGGALLVEAAISPTEIEKGLGDRDSLFEKGGMLFDLGSTRVPSFWMKGMRFPLDFVWIDESKKIAAITPDVQPQQGVPDEQLQRYAPAMPVRYVLGINAGAAATFGLVPGQQLDFAIAPALLATPTPTPVTGLAPTAVIPGG